jgi:hypothetical protein
MAAEGIVRGIAPQPSKRGATPRATPRQARSSVTVANLATHCRETATARRPEISKYAHFEIQSGRSIVAAPRSLRSEDRMAQVDVPLARLRFGQTTRRDAWWLPPLVVFTVLSSFIAYATWAALQGAHFRWGPYLSPFYSPLLFAAEGPSWFGKPPGWIPLWITPAMIILPIPAGFRLTCYYYRGAYYKAFWADPPSCAVGEPRKSYWGERSFPLILQNVHRYFLYLALAFIVILSYDVYEALWWPDAEGVAHFGIGVGTLVLALNVVLLGSYTLGCHSLRHLVGGWLDRFSGRPLRKTAYDCVSCLNRRHMLFAWCSLFSVALSDLYVRLCSMGIIHDWRLV